MTDERDTTSKYLDKIEKWTGEEDDWLFLSSKFLARAERQGYADILTSDKPTVPGDAVKIDD